MAALRGVDIAVARGEFVAITGPSGCGKSALLNLLAGLDLPSAGQALLDGERIDELDETQLALLRRRKIGFVFQFFNLVPTLTVVENVELPLLLAGRRRRQARSLALVPLGTLLVVTVATRLPARSATRLPPADALRYE